MKRILAVGAMALLIGSTAQAQGGSGSGHTNPGGGGSGIGGMIGAFIPALGGGPGVGAERGGAGFGPMAANVNGVATSFAAGANVSTNINGVNTPVPQAASQNVGQILGGSTGALASFTAALAGSIGPGPAGALGNALATLGGAPTFANLVSAVNAYNAAVAALPAGTPVPAQLLAARAALQRMYRAPGNRGS